MVPLFIAARKATAASGIGNTGAVAVRRIEVLQQTPRHPGRRELTSNTAGFFDVSNAAFSVRWRITDDAAPPVIKTIQVRVVATRAVLGPAKNVTLSVVKNRDQ
jgi:hypothetical protein